MVLGGLKAAPTIALRFRNVDVIDDADDAGVGRNFLRMERKAGFLPTHEKDRLTCTGTDRVDRNQRSTGRLQIGTERLQHHQPDAAQIAVLDRRDDIADDLRQLHVRTPPSPAATSTCSTMPTTAASTGQSFIPDAMRAELPLTMSTVSPTPASTVSTATR